MPGTSRFLWGIATITTLLAVSGCGARAPRMETAPLRLHAVWQSEEGAQPAEQYEIVVSGQNGSPAVFASLRRPHDALVIYVPVGKDRQIHVTATDSVGRVLGEHTVTGYEVLSGIYNVVTVALSTRGGNGDVAVKVGWADPPESFPPINATIGWTFEPTDGLADLVVDWLPLYTTGTASARVDWMQYETSGGLDLSVDWRD